MLLCCCEGQLERVLDLLDHLRADEHDARGVADVDRVRSQTVRRLGLDRSLVDDRARRPVAGDPERKERAGDHQPAEHRRRELRADQGLHSLT